MVLFFSSFTADERDEWLVMQEESICRYIYITKSKVKIPIISRGQTQKQQPLYISTLFSPFSLIHERSAIKSHVQNKLQKMLITSTHDTNTKWTYQLN